MGYCKVAKDIALLKGTTRPTGKQIYKYLRDQNNPNLADGNKWNAVRHAVAHDRLDIITWLLSEPNGRSPILKDWKVMFGILGMDGADLEGIRTCLASHSEYRYNLAVAQSQPLSTLLNAGRLDHRKDHWVEGMRRMQKLIKRSQCEDAKDPA